MANDDDDDDAAFNFVKMCDSLTKLGNVPLVAAADRLTIFRNLWPAPSERWDVRAVDAQVDAAQQI